MMDAPNFQDEDAEYAQLMQASAANAQYQQTIEKQKALAERLRGMPVQEGKMVSGHYIPPSPFSQIAGAMGQRGAMKADEAGSAAGQGLNASQARQNQMVLQALLRNRGGGMAPANPFPGANFQ